MIDGWKTDQYFGHTVPWRGLFLRLRSNVCLRLESLVEETCPWAKKGRVFSVYSVCFSE